MIARLDDLWFEAEFITKTTKTGHWHHDKLDGADGLLFWCPCGYGKSEFPLDGGRPHAIIISFANPINASVVPSDAGSQSRPDPVTGQCHPSRWMVSGTGLNDLTLSPSVNNGNDSCWHGYITDGIIT
jgi:hypothetical protein